MQQSNVSLSRDRIIARRNSVFTPQNIYEAFQIGRGKNYKPKSVNIGRELEEAVLQVAKDKSLDGVSHMLRLALLAIPEVKQAYETIHNTTK